MVLSSFESNLYFLLPGDLDTWPMTLTFTQDLGVIDLHQHTSCRSNGTSAAELTFCMVLNNVFDLVTSYFDLWPWPSHLTYIPSIFIIAPYFMAVSPIVQVWGHRKCKVLVYWKCTCYRPRSKGNNTFGSVRPSVCLFTWNTDQVLCVFVRNQVMFTNKSCAQRSGAFNKFVTWAKLIGQFSLQLWLWRCTAGVSNYQVEFTSRSQYYLR